MTILRWLSLIGVCSFALSRTVRAEQPVGRETVRTALVGVDQWLASSQLASAWHNRLGTDDLRRELSRTGPPDLAVLEATLRRLTDDPPRVSSRHLSALRRAVQGWLTIETLPNGRHLAAVASSILRTPVRRRGLAAPLISTISTRSHPAKRSELRAHLVALAAMLSQYAKRPHDELAESIDRHLNWLAATGEADALVDAVRQYYSYPNVWIDISEDVLDDPVARTVDRLEAVSDVILGTPLSGGGRLRAVSDLVVEPHAELAILKIVVQGDVRTQTIGRNGPARIHSLAVTRFRAQKQLYVESTGLRVLPTECTAETRTLRSSVSAEMAGLRGRIVLRVGARRWEASRGAADQEAARHVEQKVCTEVDRQADELIRRLDRLVIAPMLALASGSSASHPPQLRFCTEERVLRIGVVQGFLGAPPGHPALDTERRFAVRVHSSLLGHLSPPTWADVLAIIPSNVSACLTSLHRAGTAGRASLTNVTQFLGLAARTDGSAVRIALVDRLPWRDLAWRWIAGLVVPRLSQDGIVLRDGRWGTLVPAGLGGDWISLEWRPLVRQELSARPIAALE
jgi:hypothetical protein